MVLERVTCYFTISRAICRFWGNLLSSAIFCQVAISLLTTSTLITPLYLTGLYQSSSSPQLSIFVQQQSISFGLEAFIQAYYRYSNLAQRLLQSLNSMQQGAILHLAISRNRRQLLHYLKYLFLILRAVLDRNRLVAEQRLAAF